MDKPMIYNGSLPDGMTVEQFSQARRRAAKALSNARQRCNNPNSPDYVNYGAKGIQVLISTAQLIAEIGVPWPSWSLDRKNPQGNYEPGNVRWVLNRPGFAGGLNS